MRAMIIGVVILHRHPYKKGRQHGEDERLDERDEQFEYVDKERKRNTDGCDTPAPCGTK